MKHFKYIAVYVLITINIVSCTSWTNPTPDIIPNNEISYDEGGQNGGILQVYTYISTDNTEHKGFLITERAKTRYNSLIDKYGTRFIPALKKNDGIQTIIVNNKAYYFITAQHMVFFADMMDYYRLDKKFNPDKK